MNEKPMLAASLDKLTAVTERLRIASTTYQHTKSYLGVDLSQVAPDKLPQLVLGVPGTPLSIQVDLAVLSQEQLQAALEHACTSVGTEILELWAEARRIATAADEHCQAAKAASEAAEAS